MWAGGISLLSSRADVRVYLFCSVRFFNQETGLVSASS